MIDSIDIPELIRKRVINEINERIRLEIRKQVDAKWESVRKSI
jgi:hypothetical protein